MWPAAPLAPRRDRPEGRSPKLSSLVLSASLNHDLNVLAAANVAAEAGATFP
jgi:hypothetical protein